MYEFISEITVIDFEDNNFKHLYIRELLSVKMKCGSLDIDD